MSTVQGPLVDGTLGDVCVAANLMVVLINPLLAQFDAAIFGQFGLGALQAELSAQFNAAIAASLNLGLNISDPTAAFKAALSALLQVEANLKAALSLNLSVEINAQLGAALALAAALKLKLGGIELLLDLSLKVKIPVIELIGQLEANLSLGAFALYYYEGPCFQVGADLKALMADGINLSSHIDLDAPIFGILLLTKFQSAKGSLQFFFGTP